MRITLFLTLIVLPMTAMSDVGSRISVLQAVGGSDPELEVYSIRLLAEPTPMRSYGLDIHRLALQMDDGEKQQYTGLGVMAEEMFGRWVRMGLGLAAYWGDADAGYAGNVITELGLQLVHSRSLGVWVGVRGDIIYHDELDAIGSSAVALSWSW